MLVNVKKRFVIRYSLNKHFLLIGLINLPSVLICLILDKAFFQFTQLNFELSTLKRFKRSIMIMCFVLNDLFKDKNVLLIHLIAMKSVYRLSYSNE